MHYEISSQSIDILILVGMKSELGRQSEIRMSQATSEMKSGNAGRAAIYIVGAIVVLAVIFFAARAYWFVEAAPDPSAVPAPAVAKEEPASSATKPLPSYDRPRY